MKCRTLAALSGVLLAGWAPAIAGSHTWDVLELFSDSTGNIQFIELWEANGTPNETGVGGHDVTSNASVFTIPSNVPGPTSNRFILLATPAFAALSGAPTPDHLIPPGFFSTGGDTIDYVPWDTFTFGAGQLPTDGVNSLVDGAGTGIATPTNYAGQLWAPPGVPDGANGLPVLVSKFPQFPDASRMSLSYDVGTCLLGNTDHLIIYGFGSQLPSVLGGTYGLTGARCNIGSTSPVVWAGIPNPVADPTRLLWFLVLTEDDHITNPTEGSWGKDSGGGERNGLQASGQCSVTTKSLANSCGQ